MQQLPLEIRLADHAVFASFETTGNEALCHYLAGLADAGGPATGWIWGPTECGKSHLLQAVVADADQRGRRSAYVPLAREVGLPPGMLDGLGHMDIVCLDDIDQVVALDAWQLPLFRLYEALRQAGARMLLAARRPPGDSGIALPDLASRLASGATWRVQPLDDGGRLRALQRRARFRGLELPDDTGAFLLSRVERSTGGLFRLLDELDRASLAAQRGLTVAFVREFLAR
jgi:DnaA family protein